MSIRRHGSLLRTGVRLAPFFVVALIACATTVRQHPDFEVRRARINRVAVMQPEVEVVRLVFKGDNEPLREEAAAIAQRLSSILVAQIEALGFTPRLVSLDDEAAAAEPELRFENTQVQRAFLQVGGNMYRQPMMGTKAARSYEATIGAEVAVFAEHAGADALALAKFSGFHKSGGEIAKDVAMSARTFAATLGSAVSMQPTQGAIKQLFFCKSG